MPGDKPRVGCSDQLIQRKKAEAAAVYKQVIEKWEQGKARYMTRRPELIIVIR